MQVEGRIKVIEQEQSVGTSNFRKRGVVITTDEQYAQNIYIEFNQDKCSLLDNYSVDEKVKVSVNLRGREWINPQGEAKYFNTIQGWRIESEDATKSGTPKPQKPNDPDPIKGEDEDDLPF